ncbi:MAG: hypothetical protein IT580_21385, partial [Verrucomicrobiales bacterium]|nr:hypothetical protein [Verrucomicrobiales bacterium]
IQSIYAAGLNLEDCARVVGPRADGVEERLRTVTGELNRVIREVRQFISGLEQHPVSGSEFKVAVESLAATYGGSQSPRIVLSIDESAARRLSPLQATELLDLVREGLSNSVRHAQAREISVRFAIEGGAIRLELADDGLGFDPELHALRGRGLRNMATRADRIGADFQLISAAQAGCRILVTFTTPPSHE